MHGSFGSAELALSMAQGIGLTCAWASAGWSIEEKCSWAAAGLVSEKVAWHGASKSVGTMHLVGGVC